MGRYHAILKYGKNECNIPKNAKISIVLPWHFYLFKSSKNKKSAFRRAVSQVYIFTVAKIVHFQGQFRFLFFFATKHKVLLSTDWVSSI